MTAGQINGFAVIAAAGDFFEAESCFVKLRKLRRIRGENGDVPDPDMFLSSFEFAGAMDESIFFRHTIGFRRVGQLRSALHHRGQLGSALHHRKGRYTLKNLGWREAPNRVERERWTCVFRC